MRKPNSWRLRNPSTSVCSAVVALTTAEREASEVTLSLRQASALLTHLRHALAVALGNEAVQGRCVFCSAGLSSDRALLVEAAEALRHVHQCGACGEDSWESCASGGRDAQLTLEAIEAALGSDLSATDQTARETKRDTA